MKRYLSSEGVGEGNVEYFANRLQLLISSGELKPQAMPDLPLSHMGAIITDAIFQGGMRYTTVEDWRSWVRSRQEARTTSGFLRLLNEKPQAFYGGRRNQKTAWGRKANLVAKVARLLAKCNVESEEALKTWLQNEANRGELNRIRGVGKKTVDYLRILSGDKNAVAIDSRIRSFIKETMGRQFGYEQARELVMQTAERVRVPPAHLDYGIWSYMKARE